MQDLQRKHTHSLRNEVTLVWGSLRLAPIIITHYSAKNCLSLQKPSGLGMSENMYLWAVTVYNIGFVLLALVTGIVLAFAPFLHVFSVALLLYLSGSLLYAISTNGAMIIVSQFLAGAYNGILLTASLAYISSREFNFQDAYILKVTKGGKANSVGKKLQHHPRVKETTFSLLSFAVTAAYLVGPGMQVLVLSSELVEVVCTVEYVSSAHHVSSAHPPLHAKVTAQGPKAV